MKEKYGVNTHNQVVPGSSPGGPTAINKRLQVFVAAFFMCVFRESALTRIFF